MSLKYEDALPIEHKALLRSMIRYYADEDYRKKVEDSTATWVSSSEGAYVGMLKGRLIGDGLWYSPATFHASAKRIEPYVPREVAGVVQRSFISNSVPVLDSFEVFFCDHEASFKEMSGTSWENLFLRSGGRKGSQDHYIHMTGWSVPLRDRNDSAEIKALLASALFDEVTSSYVMVRGISFPHRFRVLTSMAFDSSEKAVEYYVKACRGMSVRPSDRGMLYHHKNIGFTFAPVSIDPTVVRIGQGFASPDIVGPGHRRDLEIRKCLVMREVWKSSNFNIVSLVLKDYDMPALMEAARLRLFPEGYVVDRSDDVRDDQWCLEADLFEAPWYLIYSLLRGGVKLKCFVIRDLPTSALHFLAQCYKMNKVMFSYMVSYMFRRPLPFEDVYKEYVCRFTFLSPVPREEFWQARKPVDDRIVELILCVRSILPSDLFPLLSSYFDTYCSIHVNIMKPLAHTIGSKHPWYAHYKVGLRYLGDIYPLTHDFSVDMEEDVEKQVDITTNGYLTLVLVRGASQLVHLSRETVSIRLIQPCLYKIFENLEFKGFLDFSEFRYEPLMEGEDRDRADVSCCMRWLQHYVPYSEPGISVYLEPWIDDVWHEDDWSEDFASVTW